MRHYSLHKFLALLLVAIGSVTVAIAQNVAKIGTTKYATLKEAFEQAADKATIELIADVPDFGSISFADKKVTLHMAGFTAKGNSLTVSGEKGCLEICKFWGKNPEIDENYNIVNENNTYGTLIVQKSIIAENGAQVDMYGGKVVSTSNCTFRAVGDETGKTDVTSSVTIRAGYVQGREGCACTLGRGATLDIYGGLLEALDNAVVAGRGNLGDGQTSITIWNSTLIGRIKSSGYVACGVYHPQKGVLNISRDTRIVAVNGVGILMRGGELKLNSCNITATGDKDLVGKVGDTDVLVGTSGIVYDRDCGYYDVANTKVNVTSSNAVVNGSRSAIEVVNTKNQDISNVFNITAGEFSSDVSAYVKDANVDCYEHGGKYSVGNFVAQIDDVKYTSATNAIANGAGKTVVLLKDCKGYTGNVQNIASDVTLDLNGKTFTLFGFSVSNEFTIKDSSAKDGLGTGTIITTGGDEDEDTGDLISSCGVIVKPGGKVNLEGGTIKNECTATGWDMHNNVVFQVQGDREDKVSGILNISGGVVETKGTPVSVIKKGAMVNVSGGELKAGGLACIAGNGSEGMGGTTINISGGILTATAAGDASAACGIYHPNEGTLKITGGTINVTDGVGVLMRGGEMTMTGGEINATGDATRTGSVGDTNQKIGVSGVIFDRDANYPAVASTKIKIDGDAKVNGAKEAVELINENNVADAKDAIKLLGGTYNKDVQSLLADGSVSVAQGDTYVVSTFYAQVGETKYASLQGAINAATAGQTVTLIHDVDMTPLNGNRILRGIEIGEGKDVVLDMNGHSILGVNANGGNIQVTSGKLTLKDSKENSTGRIYTETPYNVSGFLYSTPIVNVTDGEFVMESGRIYTVIPENTADNGQYGVGAWGSSTITINGGTIESGWYAIAGNGNETKSTTITINGGTLVSTADYAIYHPQPGKLTVKDGAVIYGEAGAIAMKKGELEVTGGTLTSKGKGNTGTWGDGTGNLGNAALNFCKPYGNVTATIKGGIITAEGDAVVIDAKPAAGKEVSLAISGGTYSSDVSQYCVEGFTATPNADGTYGISEVGDGMIFVYDKTSDKVAANGSVTIDLDQINKVSLTKEVAGVTTTLTKNFKNTGWNAFFVPFDFTLTQDMLNDFDFATLYATVLSNGVPVVSFEKANADAEIEAYFPCLIRAKATGVQSLEVGSVNYKPSTGVVSKDCSSLKETYTFYPVMENTYIAAKNGYYLNPEKNSFVYNKNATAYIPPFTYYMTIQNRSDKSYILPTDGKASVVELRVIGADEVTGITDVEGASAMEAGKVYNLQGVVVGDSVENLPKGIYIRNGRKVVVR